MIQSVKSNSTFSPSFSTFNFSINYACTYQSMLFIRSQKIPFETDVFLQFRTRTTHMTRPVMRIEYCINEYKSYKEFDIVCVSFRNKVFIIVGFFFLFPRSSSMPSTSSSSSLQTHRSPALHPFYDHK
jgi:hypothetical protein